MAETTEQYRARINQIKTSVEQEPAIRKMRNDIAEGISKTGNRQADIEVQFQSVIDGTTGKDVISAPEIIAARNGETNLKTRLDKKEQEVTAQLAQTELKKADIAYVDQTISQLTGGAIQGKYTTYAALKTAYPSGTVGHFYVEEDGNRYIWDKSVPDWVSVGAYDPAHIEDGTVTELTLANNYAPAILKSATGSWLKVDDYAKGTAFKNNTGKILHTRGNQWLNTEFKVISGTNDTAFISNKPVKVVPNVPFTISFPEASIAKYIIVKDSAGTTLFTGAQNVKSFTFTVSVSDIMIQINGNIANPDLSKMMLSNGSTALPYEKYNGSQGISGSRIMMNKYIFPEDNSTFMIEYTLDTKSEIEKSKAKKALKYPLTYSASGYRTAHNDGKIEDNTILELFINGNPNVDYYIYNLYNVPSGRQIQIRNSSNNEQIVFSKTQTAVSSSVEKCVFDNGQGYAIIDWSKVGGAGVGYSITDTQIDRLNIIDDSVESSIDKLTTTLSDDYYATVGIEFNIYNDNVIWTNTRSKYYYEWISANTRLIPFDEKLSFTPTNDDLGDVTVTLNVLENVEDNTAINVITTKTITIHVMADGMPSTPKKIMFFGDSLTDNGNIQKLVKDTYGVNAVLVGTQGTDPYKHEGRGGWGAWNYKSQAEFNGKTNPFYNPTTSEFDFGYYMANSGVAKPDIINIFLGTNNGYSIDSAENGIKWFVDKIKAYDSTIIVTVMSAHLTPDSNDGYAIKAKATTNNSFQSNMRAINFTKKINELLGGRESEGIYVIPIHINIDRVNDYEFEEKAVSSRNPTTVKRLVDNVHFYSPYGYHKLADVWYAYSKQFINQ